MAKITNKHKYKKRPPEGFSKIETTLAKFAQKLKDAESKPLKLNRPKHEGTWEIMQLNHQRSRYVYDLYYKKKMITRELYDWLLVNKLADKDLIAKWKKKGYEHLCCLRCIQVSETNQGTTCICRVPKASLKDTKRGEEKDVRCVNCGCRGCASSD
ncbi:DEKNAAC102293 [Brettanomyces naardenensis]|uniref:DEKNAAC102293 n=1 Tax=Brettanomyces naardenensis TaxID=13370 RepID=A0A448YKK7_BRENA|nr:DEKNAAC102293 [Brettanomyces naardenensis]